MTYKTRFHQPDKRRVRGAVRTEYNGYKYHSKFEALIAQELDLRKAAGEIKDWERQFKVEMYACDHEGDPKLKKSHRIDFRIHELDGSFTLLEAKGFETEDYKERRRWLEAFWLPLNLDHTYEVVYNNSRKWLRKQN